MRLNEVKVVNKSQVLIPQTEFLKLFNFGFPVCLISDYDSAWKIDEKYRQYYITLSSYFDRREILENGSICFLNCGEMERFCTKVNLLF